MGCWEGKHNAAASTDKSNAICFLSASFDASRAAAAQHRAKTAPTEASAQVPSCACDGALKGNRGVASGHTCTAAEMSCTARARHAAGGGRVSIAEASSEDKGWGRLWVHRVHVKVKMASWQARA